MRLIVFVLFTVCGAVILVLPDSDKLFVRGISLVNPPKKITSNDMAEVKRINAEWVAVIPYGFSRSGQPNVTFDHSNQWWGEKTEGSCRLIEFAKANKLKVMLKPHVWVMGQGWTGDFTLETEAEWEIWERDFSKYILNYAKVADSMEVEILCIGTEYRIPAKERSQYWVKLIREVREIYNGKITYAANWDNYENISWWNQVDFIGIDAYFPLAEGSHPSIEKIQEGWAPLKSQLSSFSAKWKKPILFTEYGFQSANGAAGKHWEVDESATNVNFDLQADAYEATFRALFEEKWFLGGFAWKWHFNSKRRNWRGTEWSPQNKPAEQVIAKWYLKNN